MPAQRTLRSNNGFTPARLAILFATFVGFAATWALFVTAPPNGLVSPFGMAISFVAGTYLMFLAGATVAAARAES